MLINSDNCDLQMAKFLIGNNCLWSILNRFEQVNCCHEKMFCQKKFEEDVLYKTFFVELILHILDQNALEQFGYPNLIVVLLFWYKETWAEYFEKNGKYGVIHD